MLDNGNQEAILHIRTNLTRILSSKNIYLPNFNSTYISEELIDEINKTKAIQLTINNMGFHNYLTVNKCVEKLIYIQYICIFSKNNIIPLNLSLIPNLTTLRLGNRINYIGSDISKFKKLRELDFDYNGVYKKDLKLKLSPEIFGLSNLKKFTIKSKTVLKIIIDKLLSNYDNFNPNIYFYGNFTINSNTRIFNLNLSNSGYYHQGTSSTLYNIFSTEIKEKITKEFEILEIPNNDEVIDEGYLLLTI